MKCKKVKKSLIAFIDKTLRSEEREKIEAHLQHCEDCFRDFRALENLYLPAESVEPIEPSPGIWNRLERKIEAGQEDVFRTQIPAFTSRLVFAALVLIIFLAAVGIGVFLGYSEPVSSAKVTAVEPEEQLAAETYLDAFDAFPRGSVASAYYSIQIEDINEFEKLPER